MKRVAGSLMLVSMVATAALAAGPPSDPAQKVRAVETAFAKTMAARDHAAFVRFLSAEAVFLGPSRVLRGRAAVADGWKKLFDGPQAPFSWAPERVEVLASGTLALSTGPVFDPEGSRVGTFNSVWRLEKDGQWRIVLDSGCPECECPSPDQGSKPGAATPPATPQPPAATPPATQPPAAAPPPPAVPPSATAPHSTGVPSATLSTRAGTNVQHVSQARIARIDQASSGRRRARRRPAAASGTGRPGGSTSVAGRPEGPRPFHRVRGSEGDSDPARRATLVPMGPCERQPTIPLTSGAPADGALRRSTP